MRKGLRKMVISSAALLLLFALVAPSMSATDSNFSTSADPTGISSSDNPYTPPASNPDGSALEPASVPVNEPAYEPANEPVNEPANEPANEPEIDPESESGTADMEEPSEPEMFEPEIPVAEEDPGDPDQYDSPILKVRGKSNPQGKGQSGNQKNTK